MDIDLALICEHWLRPCELHSFSDRYTSMDCWTSFKSSMDPENVTGGRPYGGVAWICKRLPQISYKPLDINSDRLCGVQMIHNGKVIMNFIGVYLPYHNGTVDQLDLFGETIQTLQAFMDNHEGEPFMIVGDMNASLPQQRHLGRKWYRQSPYNHNSLMLFDFICDNELYVTNFGFKTTRQLHI